MTTDDTSGRAAATTGSATLDPDGDYIAVRFMPPAWTTLTVTIDDEHRLRRAIRRINRIR